MTKKEYEKSSTCPENLNDASVAVLTDLHRISLLAYLLPTTICERIADLCLIAM
jgi:hypothetical protein